MFDVTQVDATLILGVGDHGQSAAVGSTFFGPRQYQVDVRVTVCDETFHTVQIPATVFLAVGSFQHHALKVGTGIRFGQVHRHGLTGTDTGNVFLALLFCTKLIQGVDTRLQ